MKFVVRRTFPCPGSPPRSVSSAVVPGARLPPLYVVNSCRSPRREVLTVQVDNGDVAAGDDASLAHDKPQSSSAASDYSHTTLECKGSQRSLEMKPSATLNRLGGWVVSIVGMFDANGVEGTTESSLVGGFILQSSLGGARGALILLVELGSACDWADGIYWLGEGEGCDTCGSCWKEFRRACEEARRSKHCV